MEVKIGKGLALEVDVRRLLALELNANSEDERTADFMATMLSNTTTVMGHTFYMGLRNMLMDAHASVNQNTVVRQVNGHRLNDVEWAAEIKRQSLAASEKKLAAMYAGEVRAMSERTRLAPIEREARVMALQAIQDELRAKGKKLNIYTSDQYAALVTKNFVKYMVKAKEIVELRETKPKVELDLEGLDI